MRIGDDVKLFRGTSTPALAAKVASHLNVPLASGTVSQFPDGETRIMIEESVRGADCYIVQSTCAPVNHNLMELLVLIDRFMVPYSLGFWLLQTQVVKLAAVYGFDYRLAYSIPPLAMLAVSWFLFRRRSG